VGRRGAPRHGRPRPRAAARPRPGRRLWARLHLAPADQSTGRARRRARGHRGHAARPGSRRGRSRLSGAGGARRPWTARRGPAGGDSGARRAPARLLGSRARAPLAAAARAAGGRRAAPRAPDGRRRRRAPVRRRRSHRQLGRRRAVRRQAGRADRRPRGPRPALRAQRLHVADRRARHRSALAADDDLSGPRRRDAVGARDRGGAAGAGRRARARARRGAGGARPPALDHRPGASARRDGRRRLPAPRRAAGLVHGHRVGRVVLYLRSPAGDTLVGAASPAA
jgi:hypothetical protein